MFNWRTFSIRILIFIVATPGWCGNTIREVTAIATVIPTFATFIAATGVTRTSLPGDARTGPIGGRAMRDRGVCPALARAACTRDHPCRISERDVAQQRMIATTLSRLDLNRLIITSYETSSPALEEQDPDEAARPSVPDLTRSPAA